MENLKIKFKKMNPNAVMPKQGTAGAAGFDLTAVSLKVTETTLKYDTGIAVEIPPGYVGLVFPRSSVFVRRPHRSASDRPDSGS